MLSLRPYSFINTTTQPHPGTFPTSGLSSRGWWTCFEFFYLLTGTTFRAFAITKRGSDVRALPAGSPLNLSQSCRPVHPRLPFVPPPTPHPSECQEKPANLGLRALLCSLDVQLTPPLNIKKNGICSLFVSLETSLLVINCMSGLNPNFSTLSAHKCNCDAPVRWWIHLCAWCLFQCKPAVTLDLWLIGCFNAGTQNQSCRKVSDGCLRLRDCLFCHDSFESQKCSRCDWIFLWNVCKFTAVLWEIFVFVFFPHSSR